MKSLGLSFVSWIVGVPCGLLAAALLVLIAIGLVGSGPSGSQLGLLVFGFGVAFFPAVFAGGARSPRRTFRRALVGMSLEGLILAAVSYLKLTSVSLVSPDWLSWTGLIPEVASRFDSSVNPTIAIIGGSVIFVLFLALFIALRVTGVAAKPAAGAAPVVAAAPRPSVVASPTTAVPPQLAIPPSQPAPKATTADDPDMAEIADILKNLPKKTGNGS